METVAANSVSKSFGCRNRYQYLMMLEFLQRHPYSEAL